MAVIETSDVFVLDTKYSWFVRKNAPLERLTILSFLSKKSVFPFLFLLGIVMVFGILPPAITEFQYASSGVDTQATVTDVRTNTVQRSNRYGTPYNVRVTSVEYVYQVGRQMYSQIESYDTDSLGLSDGDVIPIRYRADSPNVARWQRTPSSFSMLELYFVVAVILLLYLGVMYLRFRGEQMLQNQGRLIDGVIERASGEADSADITRQGNWFLTIHYSFSGEDGKQFTGQQTGIYNRQKGFVPEPGTPVKVLYVNDDLFRVL